MCQDKVTLHTAQYVSYNHWVSTRRSDQQTVTVSLSRPGKFSSCFCSLEASNWHVFVVDKVLFLLAGDGCAEHHPVAQSTCCCPQCDDVEPAPSVDLLTTYKARDRLCGIYTLQGLNIKACMKYQLAKFFLHKA